MAVVIVGDPLQISINCQAPGVCTPHFGECGFRLSFDLTDNLRETYRRANTAAWNVFAWIYCGDPLPKLPL